MKKGGLQLDENATWFQKFLVAVFQTSSVDIQMCYQEWKIPSAYGLVKDVLCKIKEKIRTPPWLQGGKSLFNIQVPKKVDETHATS